CSTEPDDPPMDSDSDAQPHGPRSGHVVVAPDKFKGSLTAAAVGAAVAAGLHAAQPTLDIVVLPVADGGDGTLDAAVSAGFRRVAVEGAGPLGDPGSAPIGVRARG